VSIQGTGNIPIQACRNSLGDAVICKAPATLLGAVCQGQLTEVCSLDQGLEDVRKACHGCRPSGNGCECVAELLRIHTSRWYGYLEIVLQIGSIGRIAEVRLFTDTGTEEQSCNKQHA